MDHRYIDEHSVAERYLEQELQPEELSEFEEHLTGCRECMDRVVLAGMFLVRSAIPERVRLKFWQVGVFFLVSAVAAGALMPVLVWLLRALRLK